MRFDATAMLRRVTPYVRGCPEEVVEDALRDAAIRFCDETGIWAETLPDILTTAGTSVYALTVANDAVVARLVEVSIDGEAVDELVTAKEAAAKLRAADSCTFAWLVAQRDIGIAPTPTDDQTISAEVVLKPSLAALEWPDELAEQYLQDIAHGARAALLRMPKANWRDPRAAEEQETLFRQRINAVAGLAGVGHLQERLRVRNL